MGKSRSASRLSLTPPLSGAPVGPRRSRSRSRASARAGGDESGGLGSGGRASPKSRRSASPGGAAKKADGGALKAAKNAARNKKRKAKAAAKAKAKTAAAEKAKAGGGAGVPKPETPVAGAVAPPAGEGQAPRVGATRKVGRDRSASPRVRRRVDYDRAENLGFDQNERAAISPLRWPAEDLREQTKAEKGRRQDHAPSPPQRRQAEGGRRSQGDRRTASPGNGGKANKSEKGGGKGYKGKKRSRSRGGPKGKGRGGGSPRRTGSRDG